MSKYIDPTYDAGFKLTFGRENVSEVLLVDILNALLCDNEDFEEITSVQYLNTERPSEYKEGKGIRYDILDEDECGRMIDKWIYNIKNMGVRQSVAFTRDNEIFKRLEKITSVASLTPEERHIYEADVKNTRDTYNQIRTAEERADKRGEERGIKIGRAEGRAEGEELERRKSISMMLAFGIPADQIADKYGISTAEVHRLANRN